MTPKTWVPFLSCLGVGLVFAAPVALAGDPTTADCLAATESSLALRNQHKLRDARAQLLICSAASCPADIRAECARRVGEINAALPTIVFEPKDAAGNDLVAVTVTMDGTAIAERLEGTALSIDPGEHAFTFAVTGQPPVQKRFVIHEGEKGRRERIVLGPPLASAPGPGAVAGTASVLATPAGQPPRGREASNLAIQRILALAAAGLGVVGLGVGIRYGLEAQSKHDEAHKACPDPTCPDENGVTLWSQATSAGTVSTVAFILGGVGLAAGTTLWLTAPGRSAGADTRSAMRMGLGPGTLQLQARW